MDDAEAADYVSTLPELCKQMLLRSHSAHWTRTQHLVDTIKNPLTSSKDAAKYLESSGLAECSQGRIGNKFDHLSIRLNERGKYLKNFMERTVRSF